MHRQSCANSTATTCALNEFHRLISKLLQWLSVWLQTFVDSERDWVQFQFCCVLICSRYIDPKTLQKFARIDWKGNIKVSPGIRMIQCRRSDKSGDTTHGVLSRCPYIFRNCFVNVICVAIHRDCLLCTYL